MIRLLTGSTHTGKTLLAQRLLERHGAPYLSIDHLKMGLIRSGMCPLTPESTDEALTAVLCREGLAPFSEAVVGAKRLRLAVLMTTALTVLGSVVGLLLAFYLTFIGAWSSLTGAQMALFLLAWTVPTLLISGWVERY